MAGAEFRDPRPPFILNLVPTYFSSVSTLLFLFIMLCGSDSVIKCALVCLQDDDKCQNDVRAVLESPDFHYIDWELFSD